MLKFIFHRHQGTSKFNLTFVSFFIVVYVNCDVFGFRIDITGENNTEKYCQQKIEGLRYCGIH